MPKANEKLYDKEWLNEQYVVKQRTYEDIGKDIGVTKHSIKRAMKRLGIQARAHTSKYFQLNDKEWLRKMYIDEFLSTKQIADLLGTTIGNVHSALTHANIPTRNAKESLKVKYPNGRFGELSSNWNGGKPNCLDCGKKLTRPEARYCKTCSGQNRIGENNPNWREGASPINALIRSSKEYKTWKKAVLQRDNFTCRFCGTKEGELHVDHIKPFALYSELRFDINNGRILCRSCHLKTDTWGGFSRRSLASELEKEVDRLEKLLDDHHISY